MCKRAKEAFDLCVRPRGGYHPNNVKVGHGGVGVTQPGHPDSHWGDILGARGASTTPTMKNRRAEGQMRHRSATSAAAGTTERGPEGHHPPLPPR